ncbi:hypothetical protein Pcinc_039100 [Petrolisthes cinctipes]|uniref:Uncharacterized protein n=1 Tax=Petrolisthes cinctipes TaxID=88211 RepID=A0AAE1BPI1_PETCI|nr:hypothetical protein Pcinc_039100 [Petrolisthes cinctipes]
MQVFEKQEKIIARHGIFWKHEGKPATEDQAVKVDQHLSTVKCQLRRPNEKPTTMYNPGFDDSESSVKTTTERKSTMLGATAVPSTSGQPTPPQTSTTFRASVSTTTTAAVTSSTYSEADYYCHEGLTITKNIIRFKNVKIISNNTYMSNNETTRTDIKTHNNAEDTQAQNSTGHRRKLFGKKPVLKVGDTVINSTTPLSIPRSTTPPHCTSTPHKDHIKLNPGTSTRRLLKYFRKKRIMAQWERLQESRRSLDSLSVKELVNLKFMLEERLRSFEESSSSVTSSVPSTQSL